MTVGAEAEICIDMVELMRPVNDSDCGPVAVSELLRVFVGALVNDVDILRLGVADVN